MADVSRRDLLVGAASLGATLLFASGETVSEAAEPAAGYDIKPLPFDPSKLDGISEKLIVAHHDKNYAGAVKRLSAIEDKIKQLPADAAPFQMGSLKREQLIAMNSMILHELYFGNLGGNGKIGGHIQGMIDSQFGGYDAWVHDFKLTGQSLAGGSGWVILAYSPRDKRLYNVWSADHQVALAHGVPILVMDMYEHAYQMDHGPDAKAYIDAFFRNINWEAPEKRTAQLA